MGPLPRMRMLLRSVRLGIGLRVRVRASSACERRPVPRGAGPAQAKRGSGGRSGNLCGKARGGKYLLTCTIRFDSISLSHVTPDTGGERCSGSGRGADGVLAIAMGMICGPIMVTTLED